MGSDRVEMVVGGRTYCFGRVNSIPGRWFTGRDMRVVVDPEVAGLLQSIQQERQANLDLVDERDRRVDQIERVYTALGGQEEWSNLCDLGEDAVDMAERLMELVESVKLIVTDPTLSADAARQAIISFLASSDDEDETED